MADVRTYPLPTSLVAAFPALPLQTAVLLHPVEGAPDAESSHGGSPVLWPRDVPWPVCDVHSTDVVPVLQLLRGDVPEVGFPDETSVFVLLWCPRFHDQGFGPLVQHRWLKDNDDTVAVSPSPPPVTADSDGVVPRPSVLSPERVAELPSVFGLEPDQGPAIDEWLTRNWDVLRANGELPPGEPTEPDQRSYQYHFSASGGTKVGGHPDWVQYPEEPMCTSCQTPMAYLLTVSSWEFDMTSWWRWMPIDSDIRRVYGDWVYNVWVGQRKGMTWPVHDALAVHGLGVMIGDAGSTYVFICRRCDRTYAVSQCG